MTEGEAGVSISAAALASILTAIGSWLVTWLRYQSQVKAARKSVEERLADIERWQGTVDERLRGIEENIRFVRRFLTQGKTPMP